MLRIAFLWQGMSTNKHRFSDGLQLALKHLQLKHEIGYFEPRDLHNIELFKPDVLLYWGALVEDTCSIVAEYPYKKAICFAGGPIEPQLCYGWDLYFVESEINEKELEKLGYPYKRAFGINEEIFKPLNIPKIYDAAFWGAFAQWKRPELFAESTGPKGLAIGQHQAHEPECYKVCHLYDNTVMHELPRGELNFYLNQAHTALNPSSFWGGGQRMTLEAMAMNIPPIVMTDSPKNREYVEESGYGIICTPDVAAIKDAIERAKFLPPIGRDYILSKWSSKHYADALEEGLNDLYTR